MMAGTESTISAEVLGRRIRSARRALKLKQSDLARHLDIPRTAVVQIEKGNRGVSTLELSQLAEILNRPIGQFFREDFNGRDVPYSLADAPGTTVTSAAFAANIIGLALACYRRGEVSGGWLRDFAVSLGLTIDQMTRIDEGCKPDGFKSPP